MADIAGTNVAAPIRPFTDLDTFATALANEIKGGRHCVNTIADRNNIPLDRRLKGMHCYVDADSFTYELITDTQLTPTQDSDWKVFASGGAGSSNWTDIQGRPTADPTAIDDAVSVKHTHSNKTLLDAYKQAETDLADAVGKKHEHTNLALLATYAQTEVNLADAVTKKHAHVTGELLPLNKTAGQIPVVQVDGSVAWQTNPGLQATFGGEFATKAEMLAITSPQYNCSYIVTNDESHENSRTWYTYAEGPVWKYMGAFSDGMTSGAGGSTGGYVSQWSSSGSVVTNETKSLKTSYTALFNNLPPSVLAFETGTPDINVVISEFNNGKASSFKYDPEFVEFVGTDAGITSKMQLKTKLTIPMTQHTPIGKAPYCSAIIDASKHKIVESAVVL